VNPYSNAPVLGQAQPSNLPHFPLTKVKGEAAKTAKRLHADATAATATLAKVRDHQTDLVSQLRAARAAFEQQAVSTTIDADLSEKLAQDLYIIERRCDQAILNAQSANAIRSQRETVRRYLAHVYDHLGDLVAELEPEAEAVAKKMAEALKALEPVQAEYNSVRQRVFDLVSVAVTGPHAEYWGRALAIPDAPNAPIPSAGLDAFTRAQQPAPEHVDTAESEVVLVGREAIFGAAE
jgi:hypothetical protein